MAEMRTDAAEEVNGKKWKICENSVKNIILDVYYYEDSDYEHSYYEDSDSEDSNSEDSDSENYDSENSDSEGSDYELPDYDHVRLWM